MTSRDRIDTEEVIDMAEVAIPGTMDAVDAKWLSAVLGADVSSFRSEQIGEGVGIMGQLFKVTPTYASGSGPEQVIVKLPSPFEENRAQGIALGMYEAEVRFYNEMASRTSTPTPTVHHAQITPGTGDFVIVMDDLSHLTMPDEVAGISIEQARAALRALAGLHVSWWGKVAGDEYSWIPTLDAPRIQAVTAVYPMLWQGFLAKFADVLPEGASAAGDLIAPRWGELMAWLAGRPQTLIHQDFRCENMFFGDDGTVVVIDWQALGRGPAVYDLAYLLGGSLPTDVRRAEEDTLVREYHAALVAGGVTDYPFDELWRDYRFAGMVVTAVPIFTGAQLDLANERGKTLIGGMGRRLFSAVVDHDAVSLMPS